MSRLSVVVPVYNVADCIDACLESLQVQTFNDIEILCVNDGSTDNSRELLGIWADRDTRICVIDKENGGLSSARNAGIDAATSPYVCFLDSDDRFHPHACGEIVRMLDETQADVLTFGATCTPEDAASQWHQKVLSPRDAVYNGFTSDLLFKEASHPFAWRMACRTSFLRDRSVCFDEGVRFGEDTVFAFAVYPRAQKTVLSSAKLYEYRLQRPGSLMSSVSDDPVLKMREHVKILNAIFLDWEQGGFIDLCPEELVAFALDFVVYGSLKFEDYSYRTIADSVHSLLGRYWSEEDVASMTLPKQTMRLALNACYRTDMKRSARLKLVFDYYAQQYGLLAAVFNIVRHVVGY